MTKIDFINALKTVLLAARETNSVLFDKGWVRGANKKLSVSYKFETGIEAALPIAELLGVLTLMENGYPLEVAQDDTYVRFECGPTVLRLFKLTNKENFESLDLNNAKWSPAPERLLDGLKLSLLSTHKSERGIFAGIAIKGNKIMSSDNYRMSLYEMGGEVGPNAIRIDVGSIKSLLRLKTKFDSIALTDEWLYFRSENLVAGIKLMPIKNYPLQGILSMFDQVGITDNLETYELPNNLEKLIDNVEPMAGRGEGELNSTTVISLKIEDGNLIVSGANEVKGESEDIMPWDWELPEGGIIVPPLFLKKILKVTRSFKVSPTKNILLFETPNFKFLMIADVKPEDVMKNRLARLKKSLPKL